MNEQEKSITLYCLSVLNYAKELFKETLKQALRHAVRHHNGDNWENIFAVELVKGMICSQEEYERKKTAAKGGMDIFDAMDLQAMLKYVKYCNLDENGINTEFASTYDIPDVARYLGWIGIAIRIRNKGSHVNDAELGVYDISALKRDINIFNNLISVYETVCEEAKDSISNYKAYMEKEYARLSLPVITIDDIRYKLGPGYSRKNIEMVCRQVCSTVIGEIIIGEVADDLMARIRSRIRPDGECEDAGAEINDDNVSSMADQAIYDDDPILMVRVAEYRLAKADYRKSELGDAALVESLLNKAAQKHRIARAYYLLGIMSDSKEEKNGRMKKAADLGETDAKRFLASFHLDSVESEGTYVGEEAQKHLNTAIGYYKDIISRENDPKDLVVLLNVYFYYPKCLDIIDCKLKLKQLEAVAAVDKSYQTEYEFLSVSLNAVQDKGYDWKTALVRLAEDDNPYACETLCYIYLCEGKQEGVGNILNHIPYHSKGFRTPNRFVITGDLKLSAISQQMDDYRSVLSKAARYLRKFSAEPGKAYEFGQGDGFLLMGDTTFYRNINESEYFLVPDYREVVHRVVRNYIENDRENRYRLSQGIIDDFIREDPGARLFLTHNDICYYLIRSLKAAFTNNESMKLSIYNGKLDRSRMSLVCGRRMFANVFVPFIPFSSVNGSAFTPGGIEKKIENRIIDTFRQYCRRKEEALAAAKKEQQKEVDLQMARRMEVIKSVAELNQQKAVQQQKIIKAQNNLRTAKWVAIVGIFILPIITLPTAGIIALVNHGKKKKAQEEIGRIDSQIAEFSGSSKTTK